MKLNGLIVLRGGLFSGLCHIFGRQHIGFVCFPDRMRALFMIYVDSWVKLLLHCLPLSLIFTSLDVL